MKKLVGKDGYLHKMKMGAEMSSGNLENGKWYKIKSKAAISSAFGDSAKEKDLFFALVSKALASGDICQEVTLTKVAFVTDVPKSSSKEKFDVTTQIDEVKAYRASKRTEATGSLTGYFTLGDQTVEEVLNQFNVVCEINASGDAEYKPVQSETLHFLLGRNEDPTVGEVNVYEYMPMIFDSLTADKPMDGVQPFSANYTLDGSERPSTIKFTMIA